MLDENEAAGDSRLLSDEGEEMTLSSFRGKKVVLYSYPRDHAPRRLVASAMTTASSWPRALSWPG